MALSGAPRRAATALGAAALLLAGCGGSGESRTAGEQAQRPELRRLLEDVRDAGSPGVAAIVRDESGTWLAATGAAALDPERPLRATDRFRVASITKTFVAALVLTLVEQGELALEDTVEKHLPGLLGEGERITLRQLLSHTSGLASADEALETERLYGRFLADLAFDISVERAIELADREPLHFEPGLGQRYTNTGYEVLGLVVERVTGEPLGHALARRVIQPLGLTSTSYEPEPLPAGADVAHGYAIAGSDLAAASFSPQDVTRASNFPSRRASGGMVSSVGDVARFYSALLGGELLPRALVDQLLATVETADPRERAGLGIFRHELPCGVAWGHGGVSLGYVVRAAASRDGGHVVVLAANAWAPGMFADVFSRAVDRLYCRS